MLQFNGPDCPAHNSEGQHDRRSAVRHAGDGVLPASVLVLSAEMVILGLSSQREMALHTWTLHRQSTKPALPNDGLALTGKYFKLIFEMRCVCRREGTCEHAAAGSGEWL